MEISPPPEEIGDPVAGLRSGIARWSAHRSIVSEPASFHKPPASGDPGGATRVDEAPRWYPPPGPRFRAFRGDPALKAAYIANRFPRWRGGWIFNEVRGLERAGIDLTVVSFKRPVGDVTSDQAMRPWIDATRYVPAGRSAACLGAALTMLLTSPRAFFRGIRSARRLGGRMARGSHILEVLWIASLLRRLGIEHVHAQHADYVADAALAAARCLGLPFSFAAHAYDLYTNPGDLVRKMRAATFVATCTRFNEEHLAKVWAEAAGATPAAPCPAALCYHAVDLDRFSPPPPGSAEPPASRLVSITRLAGKKGFPYLLDALALLEKRGIPFTLDIYGDGAERDAIEKRIRELGLGDRVKLRGDIAHDRIPEVLRSSGLYVLACIVLANMDRDGIPNTILEALASGVPVVSTAISGIPEAIHDGESGLLVPERDVEALAAAIERMIAEPDLRARCRAGGRAVVESAFGIEASGRRLASLLAEGTAGRDPGRGQPVRRHRRETSAAR